MHKLSKLFLILIFSFIIGSLTLDCQKEIRRSKNIVAAIQGNALVDDLYGVYLALEGLDRVSARINKACEEFSIKKNRFHYIPVISDCIDALDLVLQVSGDNFSENKSFENLSAVIENLLLIAPVVKRHCDFQDERINEYYFEYAFGDYENEDIDNFYFEKE